MISHWTKSPLSFAFIIIARSANILEFGGIKENILNLHYTCPLGLSIFFLRKHLNRLAAPYSFEEMENAIGKGAGDHNNALAIAI